MNNEIKNLYLLHNFKASRSEKEALINNEGFDWDGAILAARKAGLLNTLYGDDTRIYNPLFRSTTFKRRDFI